MENHNGNSLKERIKKFVKSKNFIIWCGYLCGFISALNFNATTMNFPLYTLLICAICGFVYGCSSEIMMLFLPDEMLFMIPLVCTSSCFYLKYLEYKK